MKQITDIEEVKRIQLDILSAFDSFCRSNGIQYTIIDGTLLGAVRHKGYIPWDDDIDVAMNRMNYDLFIRVFPSLYDGKYKLASLERDKHWDKAYACMYDDRTMLQFPNTKLITTGIQIDIFPLDEVPDDEKDWNTLKRKVFLFQRLSTIKSSPFHVSHSLIKNIIAFMIKIFLLPISKRTLAIMHNNLAKSGNGKGYKHCYEVAFGPMGENRMSINDFDIAIDYPFEDRIVLGIKNAHSVLTANYGDYMQLPPEEKRVTHHSFKAFWKD